jgi:hypothetical protein
MWSGRPASTSAVVNSRRKSCRVDVIEIAATAQESWVQLAGTVVHELGHVLAGWNAGHGKDWKAAAQRPAGRPDSWPRGSASASTPSLLPGAVRSPFSGRKAERSTINFLAFR